MKYKDNNEPAKKVKIPIGAQVLIVVIVVFTIFLCSVILSNSSVNNPQSTSTSATTNSENPTECVLIENETIKVTYQGVIDMPDISYFYVNLKINNNTDKEIWVTLESADVDGETVPIVTTGIPVYIRSGNSYLATYGFPTMNLSIDSVKNAQTATFKIAVRDKENISDIIFESELVTINLNQ